MSWRKSFELLPERLLSATYLACSIGSCVPVGETVYPRKPYKLLDAVLALVRPGDTLRYRIDRNGLDLEIPLLLGRVPAYKIALRVIGTVIGVCYLSVGLLVFSRRPNEMIGRLFFLWSYSFAFFGMNKPAVGHPIVLMGIELASTLILSVFTGLFLHLFLLFPSRHPFLSNRRRALWLYLPNAISFLVVAAAKLGEWFIGPLGIPDMLLYSLPVTVYIGQIGLALAALVRSYRIAGAIEERNRLQVVFWSTLVGTTMAYAVGPLLGSLIPSIGHLFDLFLILIPIAFAYAITRHHILGIESLVERSLVITISTTIMAMIFVVVEEVFEGIGGSYLPDNVVGSILTALIVSFSFKPMEAWIEAWVDRLFDADDKQGTNLDVPS